MCNDVGFDLAGAAFWIGLFSYLTALAYFNFKKKV